MTMLGWLNSFAVHEWLGVGVDYIIDTALIAAGIYLAAFFNLPPTNPISWLLRPLRFVGYALIILGIIRGAATYGRSVGAADCEAAWKQKNYELQIANLKRDLSAAQAAAQFKADEAKELAQQKADADDKLADYQSSIDKLSTSLSSCRRATGDDDRRLCDIIGNAAAGCKSPR